MLSRFGRVQLLTLRDLWTVANQSTLSMGFFRQEYWSGLSCLPPGDLPDPGTEPTLLTFPALAGGFFTLVLCRKPSLLFERRHFFFFFCCYNQWGDKDISEYLCNYQFRINLCKWELLGQSIWIFLHVNVDAHTSSEGSCLSYTFLQIMHKSC